MALTDELKSLDDKIKENQAQYDLGREAAKKSTLSSKHLLEICKYLTSEDLRHRPSVLEKTKFEYSPNTREEYWRRARAILIMSNHKFK